MTIKDKITPELKNRFLQEILKTIENGKERGFFICKDESKDEKVSDFFDAFIDPNSIQAVPNIYK